MAVKKASRLDSLEQVEVTSRAEWRAWLKKNYTRTEGVWLITYKKAVLEKHVDYASTVEEALCFGWIDSLPRKLDEQRSMPYLSPRKPKSVWSKLNKERIARLIESKRMTAAGMMKIHAAQQNGSWTILDATEAMEMPADLQRALRKNSTAHKNYGSFPPGARKQIIGWVLGAKTEATRLRRITATVELAAKNIRANGQTVRPKA